MPTTLRGALDTAAAAANAPAAGIAANASTRSDDGHRLTGNGATGYDDDDDDDG